MNASNSTGRRRARRTEGRKGYAKSLVARTHRRADVRLCRRRGAERYRDMVVSE